MLSAPTVAKTSVILAAQDITVYTRETLVQDFVAYMRFEQHLSKYTVRNYEFDLAKFDRFLKASHSDGMGWQEVDRAVLRAFLQHLDGLGFKINSIRRAMACLRAFYKFLRIEGHVTHSPVEDMPRMRVPAVLPRYLEWEKVEALIQAPFERVQKGTGTKVSQAGRYRNHALLQLLTATGIRISEAVGLRLHDVQLGERACIRVMGKGSKERTLPLHDTAAAALSDYIERWRPKLLPQSDHVFVTRFGLQVGRRIVQQEIKRYAAAVGITERVYPHLLRHSFATAMMRSGCPLPVLQELLGHSSIATTAIYAHVSPEHLRASYMEFHPANRR